MQTKNALVLFAGDAFSPSIMSTLTRGEQMPPVFNNIGVHVAAVGNHDLDFGAERMAELIARCDCQWLMANVLTPDTKQPFPGCLPCVPFSGVPRSIDADWYSRCESLVPQR